MKQGHVVGLSACIIKNNEIVLSKGYGYYNRLKFWKKPDINTEYQTGCTTKPVTTTAILQLYEQGKFNLDDDINLLISLFPVFTAVNIFFNFTEAVEIKG